MERITLGEALERYDETFVIAATGAFAKKGAEPGGDIRVIFDGTNEGLPQLGDSHPRPGEVPHRLRHQGGAS